MEWNVASKTAVEFCDRLAPACSRIEIVGSVKRGKDDVHDIEILMILNGKHPRPEFGSKVVYRTDLDKILAELLNKRILRQPLKKADGEKYKKFAITEFSLLNDFCPDLFIVSEKTWGIQNVIRTGPKLFSHSFVTHQGVKWMDRESGARGWGLLPERYRYVRGETCIMEGDRVLDLPEERDAIALLGHGWVEPKDRHKLVIKASG